MARVRVIRGTNMDYLNDLLDLDGYAPQRIADFVNGFPKYSVPAIVFHKDDLPEVIVSLRGFDRLVKDFRESDESFKSLVEQTNRFIDEYRTG